MKAALQALQAAEPPAAVNPLLVHPAAAEFLVANGAPADMLHIIPLDPSNKTSEKPSNPL